MTLLQMICHHCCDTNCFLTSLKSKIVIYSHAEGKAQLQSNWMALMLRGVFCWLIYLSRLFMFFYGLLYSSMFLGLIFSSGSVIWHEHPAQRAFSESSSNHCLTVWSSTAKCHHFNWIFLRLWRTWWHNFHFWADYSFMVCPYSSTLMCYNYMQHKFSSRIVILSLYLTLIFCLL